jgi:hypothetical protein
MPAHNAVDAVHPHCHQGVNLHVGLEKLPTHVVTYVGPTAAPSSCASTTFRRRRRKSRGRSGSTCRSPRRSWTRRPRRRPLRWPPSWPRRSGSAASGSAPCQRCASVALLTQRCAYMLCGSGDEGYLRIDAWGGTANGDLLTNNTLACCHLQEDKAAQRAKRFAAAGAGGAPAKTPAGNGAASTADDLQAKLKVMMCTVHSCYHCETTHVLLLHVDEYAV